MAQQHLSEEAPNIYNLFDRDYFRSYALNTGNWGDGRNFRFAARFDL